MNGLDRVFIDTNILIAATAPKHKMHAKALSVLRGHNRHGIAFYTSAQVLREYLVVATRPSAVNGLELTPSEALANINEFKKVIEILPETNKIWELLVELVNSHNLLGKRIHDANIAACAIANGISGILTLNIEDFVKLPIEVRTLAARI